MAEFPRASTFIIRLVHEPSGDVSGVVERVRTGMKDKFEGRAALFTLIQEIVLQDREET